MVKIVENASRGKAKIFNPCHGSQNSCVYGVESRINFFSDLKVKQNKLKRSVECVDNKEETTPLHQLTHFFPKQR